jgi:hypothetical protein
LVGGSVHPGGQLEQIVLAHPVGHGVRQLAELDGAVAQFLAKARLKSGHDFSLEGGAGPVFWNQSI